MKSPDSNKTSKRFDLISCRTEKDLSEGTRKILNQCSNEMLAYVRFLIIKYDLSGTIQENEIFNEGYERAVKSVRKGKPIHNLYGWYKLTCLNIAREYGRNEKKQKVIQNKIKKDASMESSSEEDSCDYRVSHSEIKNLFKNEIDYRIAFLRFVDEKSWQEVCETLIQEGYYKCEMSKQFIDSIRQRFCRVMKRIPHQRE